MPLKMDIVANQAVVDRSLSPRHYVNVWVCVCVCRYRIVTEI